MELYNEQAERTVLGSLLVDETAIINVLGKLTPDCFYNTKHKIIYNAIIELTNKNKVSDVVTLPDYLRDKKLLDKAGGCSHINDLAFSVISTANMPHYVNILKEKHQLRCLNGLSDGLKEIIEKELDAEKAIDYAQKNLQNLVNSEQNEKTLDLASIAVDTYSLLEERYKHKGQIFGLKTGFTDLDNLTGGFEKGDFVLIAARPSMGKTAFMMNIATNSSVKSKYPVLVFSLEMSQTQLVTRMMAAEKSINSMKLRTGYLDAEDWKKIADFNLEASEKYNMFINDTPGLTVTQIKAQCKQHHYKHGGLKAVYIDYIQIMGRAGKDNTNEEIGNITKELKNLARELKVPVIALSQLSRSVESRADKRPMMSDLRDSGSLEQDADTIMFLFREDYYKPETETKGITEVIISKQRNGEAGVKIELLFNKQYTTFKNKIYAI